ncbi:S1 RNA-binding domain-containing protein [Paenarthrobacter sp. NPDC091669]|uniref:S1 RNA-binding domain-containing protein n=1 Tax=Paenarthrobacter sp. NPDC091669 TaxID=3364384 RepID=UPI0037F4C9A1
MTDPLALAARRHAHVIPGHILVSAEPCVIPASVLTVDLLAERASELGVAERYTLRAIKLGLERIEEVSWFLGLDQDDTANVIGALLQREMIDYRAADTGDRRIRLLSPGLEALEGVVAEAPKVVTLPVTFDRIIRKPVAWTKRSLTRAGEIGNRKGILVLPPASGEPANVDDLSTADLTAILGGRNQVNRILGTIGATENRKYFKEAILLIYKGVDVDSVRLGLDIDGTWSPAHEKELEHLRAVDRLGISVEGPRSSMDSQNRTEFPEPAGTPKMAREEVLTLQAMADAPPIHAESAVRDTGTQASQAVNSAAIRWLGTYEHPWILDEAVTKTRRRLLIISPWITSAVVTKTWIRQIEKLATKCAVTIAWGYEDHPKIDDSLSELHAAARRSKQLAVVRLKNTHAKVLVGDDFYVTTSFNWLSFRGDKDRRYRMEEGTLVRNRDLADLAYERHLDQIKEQAEEVVGNLPNRPGAVPAGVSAPNKSHNAPPNTQHESSNARRNKQPPPRKGTVKPPLAKAWAELRAGEKIPGRIQGIAAFGVFVTLENGIVGLIHNSQLPSAMRRDQGKAFGIGERVLVRILDVQADRKRVSLSLQS